MRIAAAIVLMLIVTAIVPHAAGDQGGACALLTKDLLVAHSAVPKENHARMLKIPPEEEKIPSRGTMCSYGDVIFQLDPFAPGSFDKLFSQWTAVAGVGDRAFFRAVPPVKHVIDNVDAPTKCEICGGEHPLGRYNKLAAPKRQEISLAAMRDTIGRYRFEDGFELQVAITKGRLSMRFGSGGGCPLVTDDGKIFFCDGDIDRLEFVRDPAGHVTSVINNHTDVGQRIR